METKTTTGHSPELREGDHGLGIPRSRVEGARVLSDEEIEETRRLEDAERRGRLEKSLRQLEAAETTDHSPEPREGDYGLGIPRSRVEGARVLSDEEIEETRRLEDAERRRQFEKSLRRIETAESSFALPAGIRRALTWGGCALASVLGLILVSQVAAVVAGIRALPVPFDWIVGALAVLFAGTLSWLILQLVLMLVRLQRSPSVNLHAIQTLQERRHMQDLAAEHAEKAERELRIYLEKYPLDDDARRRLIVLGLTERECEDLAEAKRFLLTGDEPMSPENWLSAFRRRFQSVLDRVAENRTKDYAMKVGFGTALAPVAVIDKGVVLYGCMALIKELTFLYGLRPALGQSAMILARSIVQTYLGGLLQEASEAAADTLWTEMSESLAMRIPAAIPQVGAKMTEGAINGFLISRLGKRTISLLQPVRPAN